jgi:hypothetical protein
MRAILLGYLLIFVLQLSAQRECATQEYIQQLSNSNTQTAKSIKDAELFTQRLNAMGSANRLSGEFIIRIPVVVHVLYNDASQNISDAQINSQIEALNRDFRRRNADTINTPAVFKPLAADIQIEFALATADGNGRATNGIVRKATGVKYWSMDDKIKYSSQGGDDAWDSRYYLNIWVGNTRSLLGYASTIGAPAAVDGIVINTSAFGILGMSGAYDKGRTVVHEVGHWLGLKHIWGDTYCGDDGVEDTPKQTGFTTGCPTGVRTSSCSTDASGSMYMNYMDFTNDACLNLFTQGQKARMWSLFNDGAPRYLLLFSKGLDAPWNNNTEPIPVEEAPIAQEQFKFYPNPVTSEVVLNFQNDASWMGKELRILNINGVLLKTIKIDALLKTVSLSDFRTGIYFMQGVNGAKKINQKLVKL